MVEKTIIAEENRFDAVLTDGLPRLEAEIAEARNGPARLLSGDVAFRLYDTFGMPYDFIEDTAATKDVRVDRTGFERAMAAQRDKARAGSAFGGARKDAGVPDRSTTRRSRARATPSRATTATALTGVPAAGALRRAATAGRVAG